MSSGDSLGNRATIGLEERWEDGECEMSCVTAAYSVAQRGLCSAWAIHICMDYRIHRHGSTGQV